jgi:hypothetical protein
VNIRSSYSPSLVAGPFQLLDSSFDTHSSVVDGHDTITQPDMFVVVALDPVFNLDNPALHVFLTLVEGCQGFTQDANISFPIVSIPQQTGFPVAALLVYDIFQALDLVNDKVQLLGNSTDCV